MDFNVKKNYLKVDAFKNNYEKLPWQLTCIKISVGELPWKLPCIRNQYKELVSHLNCNDQYGVINALHLTWNKKCLHKHP